MSKQYTKKEVIKIINEIKDDTHQLVLKGGFYRNNFKTLFCNLLEWRCDKAIKEITNG